MKEKILALLIAKFSGARKDGLTQLASSLALQAATEEDVQALVDKIDQTKVTEFIRDYRSGVDKEIATATKTTEENLKEKFDFVEKGGGATSSTTNTEGDDKGKDTPEWAKAIIEQNKKLADELLNLKGEKTASTRSSRFNELIKNIPEKQKAIFLKSFNKMTFKDDEDFTSYLEELKPEVEAIVSDEESRGATFGRPLGGNKSWNKEASETECDEIAKRIII